jgi:chromosome segregation protein
LRRRLDALTAEVAARQAAVEDAEARASEAAESLAQAERDLQRARDAVRATEARLSAARATAVRLVHAADMAEAQRTAAMAAHELASETEATVARRLREVTLALETLADVAGFEDQLQEALDEAAERRAAVAEARSRRGTLEAERGQRHARRSAIADERARAQSRVVAASEQIAVLEARKAAAADALAAEIDADPDGIEARRAAFRDATAAAEAAHRTASDDLARAETALRSVQGSLRAAQAAVASTREGLVRIETRLEGVRQRRLEHVRKTQDALGVLPDACRDLAGDQLPDPLPAPDALEARLAGLRAERERLGGVNLAADDDLSVAQSRFDTLDGERADVEAAVAKLRDAIAALNRDAKGRLDAAFEQVDAHFRRLFDVLFGGGEARLDMIRSETDPLEGGLEIIARPPGKKPATLSLLSGGEQTLTALSLIFAVFLTNPAPICVLDEVDAPLDDSNVDRFCTLMERMAAETATRFLVITHHPMTMARMNRLFGVTMAEKGVSQLVSVDLEAAQKIVETDVAA